MISSLLVALPTAIFIWTSLLTLSFTPFISKSKRLIVKSAAIVMPSSLTMTVAGKETSLVTPCSVRSPVTLPSAIALETNLALGNSLVSKKSAFFRCPVSPGLKVNSELTSISTSMDCTLPSTTVAIPLKFSNPPVRGSGFAGSECTPTKTMRDVAGVIATEPFSTGTGVPATILAAAGSAGAAGSVSGAPPPPPLLPPPPPPPPGGPPPSTGPSGRMV